MAHVRELPNIKTFGIQQAANDVEAALYEARGHPEAPEEVEEIEEYKQTKVAEVVQQPTELGDVGPAARIRGMFGMRVMSAGPDGLRAGTLPQAHYANALRAWREQKAAAQQRRRPDRRLGPIPPTPPAPAPATNWVPIGPSVVRRGQAAGNPAVSGRTADVAIAPGGMIVYAATANGGAWRSNDGGRSWTSLMDAFDLDPTNLQTDTLACGAIAIDPLAPDRVYVGTGEGEASIFFKGVFGVVFSYAGVGPLRSDDGGQIWHAEPVDAGSPTLNGEAFFQLAVDPVDREHVVAATTAGIYQREPDGAGAYKWVRRNAGVCSSVVVARAAGTTEWFAALEGGTMLTSTDGATWTALGTGYPTTVSRVSLAVQPDNTDVVYAFSNQGVHRLDVKNGTWKVVSGAVAVGQSNYNMSIAVDPSDINRLFLAGTSLARAIVASAGGGPNVTYSMTVTPIGGDVHPDMHRLVFRSDAANELWIATDGGLFRSVSPSTTATFEPRNTGLATMTLTYLDHHPTEAAVVFCGAQDNGTLRYTGEEAWLHSADGDGGANVVNWADPYRVIRSYIYGNLYRTTDGGKTPSSWSGASPGASGALFYPPLVGTPINPATPAEAEIIAMGADRTWFSPDFGSSWSSPDTAALQGTVSALVFASANRAYAGTTTGRVYSYTRTAGTWAAGVLIGQVGGGGATSTGLAPIVTDVVIDPADATGASFYVCLGGLGDWRRIWHFDGTTSPGTWQARSGPSAGASTSVLDVHFNALAVDPMNTSHVFAGADIGIWLSTDGGANWTPYADGLPDAGVVDMKLHATRRLLRVATYGRGAFERDIDASSALGVELYVRDTSLDLGKWPTIDWLADPEDPTATVRHWRGPNIKVDPPSSAGTYQTTTTQLDFLEFIDKIVDGSDGVATVDSSVGTAINRVYVEVHNRGVTVANNVQVMLLLTNASAGLPSLPSGYTANVQSGTAISTSAWKTVGTKTINGLKVGAPQVVEFDLPSTMLPPPASLPGQAHYCVLTLLHSGTDPFTNTQTGVDALSIGERKAAHRNLHIVEFTGTLPGSPNPHPPTSPMWAMIELHGTENLSDVLLDLTRAAAGVTLVLPRTIPDDALSDRLIVGGKGVERERFADHLEHAPDALAKLFANGRFDPQWTRLAESSLRQFAGGRAIRFERPRKSAYVGLRELRHLPGTRLLLAFDAPHDVAIGDQWEIDLIQADSKHRTVLGGSTYHCRIVLPPDDERSIALAVTREMDEDSIRLIVHPHTTGQNGKAFGHNKGEKLLALRFTAQGVDGAPRPVTWDAKKGAYVLTIPKRGEHSVVRRVIFVAQAGGKEGRKTVAVSAG